jgi:hypothetical protein
VKLTLRGSTPGVGNAFGYSTHAAMLAGALVDLGVELVDDAETVLHLLPFYYFKPEFGRRNVLYSMWEFAEIPEEFRPPLQQPDLIVVPCEFSREVIGQYTAVPIRIAPEGVDVDRYYYKERSEPDDGVYTWLYVGAKNARKGFNHVVQAWVDFYDKHQEWRDKTRLILKFTSHDRVERFRQISPNVWEDSRILPRTNRDAIDQNRPTLADLYHYAHGFLLPTMGEGWGLTLCEAMATGLPSIVTPWSSIPAFADESNSYPVRYEMKETRFVNPFDEDQYMCTHNASADIDHIIDRMIEVMEDYPVAVERGRRASETMRQYTWRNAAERLLEAIA